MQAALCSMRGARETIFESDFPLGTDMIGRIIARLKLAEQVEAEMFTRLHH